ncbi:thap domain-containing protein, partial [Lasius niger]
MPGCSAEDCTNSSVKGFKMTYFPRDPYRQAKWIANVKRANWISTDNSTLCEVHFAQDMWEKPRVDAAIDTAAGSSIEKNGDVYPEVDEAIIEDTIAEYKKNQILKNSEASNGGEDEREGWPEEWKEGVIIPIVKKGRGDEIKEYRGVTLMPSLYKIYTAVLGERLRREIEKKGVLAGSQAGFRREMGTVDQIYALNYIVNRQ